MLIVTTLLSIILSSLTEVRNVYNNAIGDGNSENADKLVSLTSPSKTIGVYRAYYATGLALQAKHSWNPSTKLTKCNSAYSELNAAVKSESTNLEIRFLRFSFESNIPSFLDLSNHLKEDKTYILSHLDKTHPIWNTMKAFLKNCEHLTDEEKKKIP